MQAICACLGVLTIFVVQVEKLAGTGSLLAAKGADDVMAETGRTMLARSASALRLAREDVDRMMARLGNFLSNQDACSATTVNLSNPVYEVLRKRAAGESLDD